MDIQVLSRMLPVIAKGSIITIELTCIALIFGSIIGVVLALSKLSKILPLRIFANGYTWILRGTPMLLQLFVLYYGLPSINIKFTPFQAAVIGLSLNCGAYMCEIIRGGIQSIDKGQVEACRALSLNYVQTMTKVIMPQAFRVITPAIGNEFITLLKDTSIVSTITLVEIMRSAQAMYASSFKPIEAFFIAGSFYLILTTVFTVLFSICEKKLSVY